LESIATWANSHGHHFDAVEGGDTRNTTVSLARMKAFSSFCHFSP
jgi:hypothetical protein